MWLLGNPLTSNSSDQDGVVSNEYTFGSDGVAGVGVTGSSTIVVVFLQEVKNTTKRSVPQSILFIQQFMNKFNSVYNSV
jgi:hypothetical protein